MDIDRTCAMMTVCNLMFHGIQGEVAWGDSLKGEIYECWAINPFINSKTSVFSGAPHCVMEK